MSVNFEVKGHLARLLATENLVVEHRKVSTASFDVINRILVLPLWERAENCVYDLLVAHEVGHALYTPNDDWTVSHDVPASYVNITEDARVEKLMKRRYPGLSKTFYRGYQQLNDDDFFEIGDDDIDTYNFPDRANLYFKVGNYVKVPINNPDEEQIIKMISDSETFEDAICAAEKMYEYMKKTREETKKEDIDIETNNQVSGSGSQQMPSNDDSDEQETPVESESYGGTAEKQNQTNSPEQSEESNKQTTVEQNGAGDTFDDDLKTDKALSDNIRKLSGNSTFEGPVYVEFPKVKLDKVIVSNSEIHKHVNEYWDTQDKVLTSNPNRYYSTFTNSPYEVCDAEFKNFKTSAQKEVNYLVKEFECRKAADSYARASTARTGVLDCSKLHTYKYNEDLFKKVTTLADGKNHGLVFILDWSGSMSSVLTDTLKQLYNLIWFCHKCNIPFDVYAFTNEWKCYSECESLSDDFSKKGYFSVNEQFSLMNLFTSKVRTKELNEQMKSIYRIAYHFVSRYTVPYSVPTRLGLSGTPLNESMVCLSQILPQFQKDNNLQKVHCVILTDGEAQSNCVTIEVKRNYDQEPRIGVRGIGPNMILRNRKNGHSYPLTSSYYNYGEVTKTLLTYLRDQLPSVNFIGMRIAGGKELGNLLRSFMDHVAVDKYMSIWKKDRSVCVTGTGYTKHFILSSASLQNSTDFEVAEDATKVQIKNAFAKSLKSKKLNKKVLGEFISLVA